jgi:hypothetical protein
LLSRGFIRSFSLRSLGAQSVVLRHPFLKRKFLPIIAHRFVAHAALLIRIRFQSYSNSLPQSRQTTYVHGGFSGDVRRVIGIDVLPCQQPKRQSYILLNAVI